MPDPSAPDSAGELCQACGACCAFSPDWPRFTTETAGEIAALPHHLLNADETAMRWDCGRCAALRGEVGRVTCCTVYEDRPDVCRACQPGDDACNLARARHGMAAVVLGRM
jgi:Fe-S-cluster containining protein